MLDLYIIFIEMKELGLTYKRDHKKRMEAWRDYVKHKMTNKITMSIIPIFFNYANETLISTYIEENCLDFIQKFKKDSYFIITCKILQYPNRVLSVRLILSMCYKVPEDERDDSIDPDLYQTEVDANGDEENENLLLESYKTENNKKPIKTNPLIEEK